MGFKKILAFFTTNNRETLTQILSNAQKQRPIIKISPELKSVIRHT